MLALYRPPCAAFVFICILVLAFDAHAQSGSSTSVVGKVVDQTGAVVPNATVEIRNSVSGFKRSTSTDSSGNLGRLAPGLASTGAMTAVWWLEGFRFQTVGRSI